MMKNRTRLAGITIILLFFTFTLDADVWFEGLELSESGQLLFYAQSNGGGSVPQGALFSSRLEDLSIQQLSAFPEKLDILENGRTIQVRSAFGVFRIPVSGGLPRGIAGFPSFADGAPVLGGRVESMASSGDGRWILYVDPVSAAYGRLVLIDVAKGEGTVISDHVERPGSSFPACWSPDSRVFVYSRNGKLYYYTIGSGSIPQVDERYRLIGDGTINSVYWGQAGDFFYIKGSTVFRVRSSELFARALYTDFLEIGLVAGTIPLEFDVNFDEFWVAPDSKAILLSKEKRNLFYFPLGTEDSLSGDDASMPYIILPRSSSSISVLWPASGIVTVLVTIPEKDGFQVGAYRIHTVNGDTNRKSRVFARIDAPRGEWAALSPDGTKALVWGRDGIFLYDYASWKASNILGRNPVLSAAWLSNDECIAGDVFRIERLRLDGQRGLVCLSSVNQFGFEEGRGRILARAGDSWFLSDGKSPWQPAANAVPRASSQVSGTYRVYLENQPSGPYRNIPMIRNTASVGTVSLLPGKEGLYDEIPVPGKEIAGIASRDLFSHGARTGLRELALCFDLIDDDRGVPAVLDLLTRFKIKATFFLNGEFIRRHPGTAKDIVNAGHEAASMFFAPIDLSDARYRIDRDFITRGLARNEDEFFNASGAELSLLWHAPYYVVSGDIVAAAASAGYRTIGRDIDPMDWVLRKDARGISLPQNSASDMVDTIIREKRPGSIIPVRLGLLPGGRDDYLFKRLDVLLDALVRSGYSVVPVSTLMEHSR